MDGLVVPVEVCLSLEWAVSAAGCQADIRVAWYIGVVGLVGRPFGSSSSEVRW
jgi:hypothetical protein